MYNAFNKTFFPLDRCTS